MRGPSTRSKIQLNYFLIKHINVQVAKRLKGEVNQSYKEEKSKVIKLLST